MNPTHKAVITITIPLVPNEDDELELDQYSKEELKEARDEVKDSLEALDLGEIAEAVNDIQDFYIPGDGSELKVKIQEISV